MPTAQGNALEKGTQAAYRADHVGSFLRPPELLEARKAGDAAKLREIEDAAILRVLAKQKELGFDIFTDGEFRRSNFMGDFTDAVEGFDFGDGLPRSWNTANAGGSTLGRGRVAGVVVEKLRVVRPLTGHELPFLKKHSPGDIKMTLPSATQFPAISFKAGRTDKAYKNHSELLWDIVEIMKAELARLAAEGVKYIQIDAPRYSYFMDPKWREWIRTEMKVEPDAWLEESIRADNACFQVARRPGVDARAFTFAAAIAAATGTRKAATIRSRRNFSRRWMWTGFCWNTTMRAPARSSLCASFPRTRRSCSG